MTSPQDWSHPTSGEKEFWDLIGPIEDEVLPRWTPGQVRQWLVTDSGIDEVLVAVANAHPTPPSLLDYVEALARYLYDVDDRLLARILPMEDTL